MREGWEWDQTQRGVPAQTLDQNPTNMEGYLLPSQSEAGSKLIQQA